MPSIRWPGGGVAPASFANVGKKSMVITISPLVVPAAITPGQEAMNGTRWPPSCMLPFLPCKRPFAEIPRGAAAPLSEQKISSVFVSR